MRGAPRRALTRRAAARTSAASARAERQARQAWPTRACAAPCRPAATRLPPPCGGRPRSSAPCGSCPGARRSRRQSRRPPSSEHRCCRQTSGRAAQTEGSGGRSTPPLAARPTWPSWSTPSQHGANLTRMNLGTFCVAFSLGINTGEHARAASQHINTTRTWPSGRPHPSQAVMWEAPVKMARSCASYLSERRSP